jgi:xylulokinase
MSDCAVATFSSYFDIYNKRYWPEMLDACGIMERQLPPLVDSCTDAGNMLPELATLVGLPSDTRVNIGTLDHFAGMIGTGNVEAGTVSLSTGTVMALATFAKMPEAKDSGIAMHYGFIPGTYVMLPVAESGGYCLEWFKKTCMGGTSYEELNEVLSSRNVPPSLMFLPYIAGTNAPEYEKDACGAFLGLRSEHDVYDMAFSVMEGVAFLLKKNCDLISRTCSDIGMITATGGATGSPIWCQLFADVTGIPIEIPAQEEAACLGAAIIGAVANEALPDYKAATKNMTAKRRYEPGRSSSLAAKYKRFQALYEAMLKIVRM